MLKFGRPTFLVSSEALHNLAIIKAQVSMRMFISSFEISFERTVAVLASLVAAVNLAKTTSPDSFWAPQSQLTRRFLLRL